MGRVATALAVAVFTVVAVRTAILAVPFMNPDNLAYLAWGEELRGGHLPTVENALTTPHPAPIALMAIVGDIVSPLGTWAALAALGLAGMVAGATLVAWRRAGPSGACAALVGLGLSGGIWRAGPLRGIDLVAAGLIGLALALPPARRDARLVALVAAGLFRPEAWLLPPLHAFLSTRNPRTAVAWGVAAPALWLLFDAVLFGDPLEAFHRTDALSAIAAPGPDFGGLVGAIVSASGIFVLAAGAIGARRLFGDDALPALVLATVPLVLLAEHLAGLPVRERYALLLVPAAAGAAGSLFRFGDRLLRVATPVLFAVIGIALAAGHDVGQRRLPLARERAQAAAILARVPPCAEVGVTGLGARTPGLLPPLAVLTGRRLRTFVAEPAPGATSVVLSVGGTPGTPVLARGDGWVLSGLPSCA
jgi:hypothetical protein